MDLQQNSRLGCCLTRLSLGQTINVAVLLHIGSVEGKVAATAAAVVVVLTILAVVLSVLAVVLTILAVVLTILAVLAILTVVLAELGLGNAGCEQHGQNGGEAHDDG
jgi:hypothetical protein